MIKIVPQVKSIKENDLQINFDEISLQGDLSEFAKKDLQSFITDKTEYNCSNKGYIIEFKILSDDHCKEWYSIDAQVNGMTVCACTEEGIFRAVTTLKQILSQPLCGFTRKIHLEDLC